jgi:hypothetical protein
MQFSNLHVTANGYNEPKTNFPTPGSKRKGEYTTNEDNNTKTVRNYSIQRFSAMNEHLQNEDTEIDYIGMMREAMETWYSRPSTGWHVTDVVLCPRQRIFKEIDPLPITDKDLSLYSSGRAVHEAVQSLFMSNPRRFEKEKYVDYKNIEGSIDIFDKIKIHLSNLRLADQPM